MDRLYSSILREHHAENRQMAFVAGPRQVGKTTACLASFRKPAYLNWDQEDHRQILASGPGALEEYLGLNRLGEKPVDLVLHEIHKYGRWKNFLKGFFDLHERRVRVTVTGSSRLDVYKKGGDSLLGRYFLYRMHPLSVGELLRPGAPDREIAPPRKLPGPAWEALKTFGGFPEPFTRAERRFSNRWKRLRFEQVLREDLRDLTRVQELAQIQLLAQFLENQAGQLTTYSSLAEKVRVSVDTIRRWVSVLESLYFCFAVRPWSKNVVKSLIKEPKIYLYEWSVIEDEGFRFENMVALHLLKSAQLWTDLGFGEFSLHYLRDKLGREVDFLVAKDRRPWFLVEAKTSGKRPLHGELFRFQSQTGAQHAFQAVMDLPYVDADCFAEKRPVVVPALTLLSQLA